MWTFSYDDLVTAREEAKRDAEEYSGNTAYQRLGRAHLWLDEPEEARRWFRAAADDIEERVFGRGRGDHLSTWRNYGHLLRHAGDEAGARAAFERAASMGDDPELHYLLGGDPGDGDARSRTLRRLAAGDREAAREEIVKWIRAERWTPDGTAHSLTLFDLLEETFPDEPSHLEMLRRSGLLRDGPRPPAPAIDPPPVGRWTIRDAVLENDGEGPIVARVGGGLCVELVESFGQWEVRLYRGDAERGITGMHDTFGEAIDAALDALRAEDDYAVAGLTDLLKQYGQPH